MFDIESPWFNLAKALEEARKMDYHKQPTDDELHKLWSEQKPARAAEREEEE